MQILNKQLNTYIKKLKDNNKLNTELKELYSVYPFNKFEYTISNLLSHNIITLDDYTDIRQEYIARNRYLYIFEISAPRTFGEKWAQTHLNELVPELNIPTKKLDTNYSGQYDFFYKNIAIEVKASRVVDFNSDEALYEKALLYDSNKKFNMNFQQIKPKCCEVFVWVAVWRDKIKYWVLSSKEVENNKYYSKGQHRGNEGEGQLHITEKNINEFKQHEVKPNKLLLAIKQKAKN